MTRVLVTAFDPFGGDRVNASLEAVQQLPPSIAALAITTVELPTSFRRSLTVLERAIARSQPDIILCVGQAADRATLCMERVAINLQDARIADNDGAMPVESPVVAGGPAAYFSTLPVKATVSALLAAQLPAAVSNSAGTFVCNHVFYGLMHHVARQGRGMRAGLLHVPHVRRHADDTASMAIEDIVRGIVIALEVAVAS